MQFQIGSSPFEEIVLVGRGYDHTLHTGGLGGDHPVKAIFKANTFQGRGFQLLRAVQVDLGVRFPMRKLGGGGDRVEVVADAQFLQDDFHQREGGGGGEADPEFAVFEEAEDIVDAGQGQAMCVYLFDGFAMDGFFGGRGVYFVDAKV